MKVQDPGDTCAFCGKEEKATLCAVLHRFLQSAPFLLHSTAMLCLMTAVIAPTAVFNSKSLHFAPTHCAFSKLLLFACTRTVYFVRYYVRYRVLCEVPCTVVRYRVPCEVPCIV